MFERKTYNLFECYAVIKYDVLALVLVLVLVLALW